MTARFTQEDTYRGDVMDVRSLNLYAYCYNDPVNFVDPSGHDAREVINVETKASDNGKWVTVTTTTASGTKYTTTVSSTDYNGGGIIFNGSGKSHTTGLNIGDVVMGGSIIGNTSNGSGGILSDVSNFMSLNSTAQDNVYTAYISYQNGDISISNYVESVQQNGGSLAYISPTSADAVKLTETGENRRLQEIAQALDKGLQSSEAYEGFLLLQQINGWSDDDIVASAEMFGVGIGGGGKGQVIFMTHGLRSDAQAFQTTVRNLKDIAPC